MTLTVNREHDIDCDLTVTLTVTSLCSVFRTLCGWMLPPRVPFLKLIETEAVTKFYEENYVMQDWLVPLSAMKQTIVTCHQQLAVYPLWLCPFRVFNTGK